MVYLPKGKKVGGQKATCPVCRGTGKVKVEKKGPSNTKGFEEIACPRCNGSGYIYV